jgi:4-amino-4-deoxy-L-arabinose transferase-like glycosyltransferase
VTRRDLAVIALVAGVARVALLALTGAWGAPRLWEYDDIARNILAGRGFVYDHYGTEYRGFTTPGWPFVLAVLLRVGDYRLVQGVQALFCVLLGASAYLVVRHAWSRRAGLLAGTLCVLHPGLVYYSVVNSDPLPLNAWLVFLIAAALLPLADDPRPAKALGPGALIGLSLLTRGTTLLLLPVAAVWLLFTAGWRRTAAPLAVLLLVPSVMVTPWLLRNWTAMGAPAMTSTGGEMLWWGNNPEASGGIEAVDGRNMRDGMPPAVRAVLAASPRELVHDRAFRDEALRFIRTDPAAFAALLLRKLGQFWWFGPFSGKEYPRWFLALYKPLYALELILAMAGVVVAIRSRHRATAWLLLTVPLAISVFQSLFYVQGRHRWMVESFVLVFVAVAAARALEWYAGAPGDRA